MKTTQQTHRSRSEIIGAMANLSSAMLGHISTYNVESSSGAVHTYHKLQYWDAGKTVSVHIPEENLTEFEMAVKDGERLKQLAVELTRSNAASVLSTASALKKIL